MTDFAFLADPFRHRDTLLQVARALSGNLEVPRVLRLTVEHVVRLLAGDAGLVALRRPDDRFDFVAGAGIPQAQWAQFAPLLQEMPLDLTRAGWKLGALRGRLVRSMRSAGLDLGHLIAMPMVAQRVLIGVVFIFRRREASPFSAYDEQVLAAFAEHAAVAIRNALFVQQLRDERERLATVLAHAADGVLLLDDGGRVQEINAAMVRMSGWEPDAAIGQFGSRIVALVSPSGVPLPPPLLPPGQSSPATVEGYLLCADGRRGPYVGAIYASLGEGGGTVVTVRDLTAQHETEQAKQTFIAGISHELKTPLTLILGYAETLARADVTWSAEQVRDALTVIREETLRLTGMVDDLLDLARIEAGGLHLTAEAVALDEMVSESVATFGGAHPDHTFTLTLSESPALALADRERLTQALRILLSNAVKYSPAGTTVHVATWTTPREVGIRVTDEGPGVAEVERERIFERFVRGEAAAQTEGAGLGLALARAIAEAHGGRIWVEGGATERGATFVLALPRAEPG